MLQSIDLLLRDLLAATELSVLSLLDVSEQLFLGLTATERTVLLRMHSQLEELFVVLSIVPAILVHLLLEAFKGIGDKCMWVSLSKLALLLLCQFDEFWSNCSRHLSALSEDHTPDSVVHHHVTSLALLHSEEVHQGDVLGIL